MDRKINDGWEFGTICTSDVLRRINALPSAENEQVKWERDVAMAQLAEYDIPFGMKKDEDIVRVVRCKDCKNATYCYLDGYVECSHWDRACPENAYCFYGERQVICK